MCASIVDPKRTHSSLTFSSDTWAGAACDAGADVAGVTECEGCSPGSGGLSDRGKLLHLPSLGKWPPDDDPGYPAFWPLSMVLARALRVRKNLVAIISSTVVTKSLLATVFSWMVKKSRR
jgi:hypothetical protein